MRVNQNSSNSFCNIVKCFTSEVSKTRVGFCGGAKDRLKKLGEVRTGVLGESDVGGGKGEKNAFAKVERVAAMVGVSKIV